jgi:hypothetical protein
MDARVLVSHGIGGLQVKALAVVDINIIGGTHGDTFPLAVGALCY